VSEPDPTEALCSLVLVAEDIRDGRRTEAFTHEEIASLCDELRRAIALLSDHEGVG